MSKPKDYATSIDPKWCPGCGDYAILAAMQRMLAKNNISRENTVFVSGIGCAGRFPYYLNTYGFHGIHGRAPAIATGLKLKRPELSVWIVTGDGDGLSIGAGHLMHLMRRNLDVNILLINNQVYGLTKGQHSPTSPFMQNTKSTPEGNLDSPVHPLRFALANNCSFVARGTDTDSKGLIDLFERAMQHKGTSFIEVLQNCPIFNDGCYGHFTDKAQKQETTIWLEDNQPMIYGQNQNKGLTINNFSLEKIEITQNKPLVHHLEEDNLVLSQLLAEMDGDSLPLALGVLRSQNRPVFEQALQDRKSKKTTTSLESLLSKGNTWVVQPMSS